MKALKWLPLLAAVLLQTSRVDAARVEIPVMNSGVDASGQSVADNAPDPHWTLVEPGAEVGVPLVATSAGGFPIGPWIADSDVSAWTTTLNGRSGPGTTPDFNADYHYQTTFSMSGLDPTTAVIEGRFGYDNFLQDVLVNGTSTGISYPAENPGNSFGDWTEFAFDADDISNLTPGDNAVTFIVRSAAADAEGNDFNGFRVEFTNATAELIPEPTSITSLLIGAGLLLGRLRRKRN